MAGSLLQTAQQWVKEQSETYHWDCWDSSTSTIGDTTLTVLFYSCWIVWCIVPTLRRFYYFSPSTAKGEVLDPSAEHILQGSKEHHEDEVITDDDLSSSSSHLCSTNVSETHSQPSSSSSLAIARGNAYGKVSEENQVQQGDSDDIVRPFCYKPHRYQDSILLVETPNLYDPPVANELASVDCIMSTSNEVTHDGSSKEDEEGVKILSSEDTEEEGGEAKNRDGKDSSPRSAGSSSCSDPIMVSPAKSAGRAEGSNSSSSSMASSPVSGQSTSPPSSSLTVAVSRLALARKMTSSSIMNWVDDLLKRYTLYMQSGLNQDRGLKFLQWTFWLVSRVLQHRHGQRNQTNGGNRHALATRKLYLDLCYARYALRLLGLPAALEAARTSSWTSKAVNPKNQPFFDLVGKILAWTMVGYYPTEHMAYVQWMVPAYAKNNGKGRSAERWSYISCRFWLAYIVAESAQCLVQWKALRQAMKEDNAQEESEEKRQELALKMKNTKLQLTRNALFLLPCVNWSLPNWDVDPWLPESIVNVLMWLESVVCLYQ